jgi:prolyl oligopeptidase
MMRQRLTIALGSLIVAASAGALKPSPAAAQAGAAARHYPPTPRGAQVDDIHGVRVADPYRWLEDITSPDVRQWIDAQNAVTRSYLASIEGGALRDRIRARLTEVWNYREVEPPLFGGDKLFLIDHPGPDEQPVIYVQDRPKAAVRVLLDANALSADGSVTLATTAPSPDGRYFGYGVSIAGSDWKQLRVRDVRTGKDLGDTIQGVRGSGMSWTHDGRGFFYVRSDFDVGARTANPLGVDRAPRVFYHRVGQRQSQDQLIYERPDHPDWLFDVAVSDDGQYVVVAATRGREEQNRLFFIDLDRPKRPNVGAPIVTLFDAGDAKYQFLSSRGSLFYLLTTRDAPRGRVVAVDINAPHPSRWTTVVRETYNALVGARRVGDRMIAHRLKDARSTLELYGLDGSSRGEVALPGVGTVGDITIGFDDEEFYFAFSSFLVPPTVFRYVIETRTVSEYRAAKAPVDLAKYVTSQLFYNGRDGMRIPLFVVARSDVQLSGANPTLLAAFGGFARSMTPAFSPEIVGWLEAGGVYAVANVRGGGEYGRAWHEAATLARKQTSIDDLTAAADFLVAQRYTRPSSLALTGQGAGGIVAAAAVLQRPQLAEAVVIDGGVLDMARFDKFTVGPSWIPEFGTPSDPAQLKQLLTYSPLQNVREGVRYPAFFLTVGENDDRIAPIHSYKFAAALQNAPSVTAPILLRVEPKAGHSTGMSVHKAIAVAADRLTFLATAFGLKR